MVSPVAEFDDIQGLVRSGYGSLDEAVFLLLRIRDATAAKAWLRDASAISPGSVSRITTAAHLETPQDNALHIAFTAHGMRNLGLQDETVLAFSREFHDGMASQAATQEGRPRRLGDLGTNAPEHWIWGGGADVPDALLMLYGKSGGLAAYLARVKAEIAGGFAIEMELPTTFKAVGDGDRVEHFGFIDGISQPLIDWKGVRSPGAGQELDYGNLITPGEFLLGYVNEYGLFEDRPLLTPEQDPLHILSEAADEPGKRDFARNGSYLVLRQLAQDVGGFWSFLAAQDPGHQGTALAEAMVGRALHTGDPLIKQSTADIPGVGPAATDKRRNGFTFTADSEGLSCPFGAHIRRANPRTADMPGGKQGLISRTLRMLGFKHGGPREDLISSARFHRVLRRGRAYGPFTDNESGQETGLHFICLNANISRQFEFVQNAWLTNPTFNGMTGESDPLLGNRLDFLDGHSTDSFTIPRDTGLCRRVTGLPQFVTVRGGAYFFLPSLRALRFLAR